MRMVQAIGLQLFFFLYFGHTMVAVLSAPGPKWSSIRSFLGIPKLLSAVSSLRRNIYSRLGVLTLGAIDNPALHFPLVRVVVHRGFVEGIV